MPKYFSASHFWIFSPSLFRYFFLSFASSHSGRTFFFLSSFLPFFPLYFHLPGFLNFFIYFSLNFRHFLSPDFLSSIFLSSSFILFFSFLPFIIYKNKNINRLETIQRTFINNLITTSLNIKLFCNIQFSFDLKFMQKRNRVMYKQVGL